MSSIPYGVYDPNHSGDIAVITIDEFTTYTLPVDKAIKPVKMEVHRSSEVRGPMPRRICLLSGSKTAVWTFELPEHTEGA